MPEYQAPLKDMLFLLEEVFAASKRWQQWPELQGHLDQDTALAVLNEGAKLCSQVIAPLNLSGDLAGAKRHSDGRVTTPQGFKEAFAQFAVGGWQSLGGATEYGGMGMPKQLSVLFEEMLYAANTSFALYPALTAGACLAIDAHGDDAMKSRFLPKLYAGEWAASMCLTEPQCGTDLGLVRTRAELDTEGTYSLTGTKIFITGGEHDLNENIIHLVLAKLPDAPSGSKGVSLFLVPKIWVHDDGSLGAANGVNCSSIEHKMGIKASATCVLNFDKARAYLVGQPHRGLPAMFTMMNYERLSIGLQGIGCGDMSYQTALAYAKERLQGRSPQGTQKSEAPADPIIMHPDIRRMLMTMKAFNEGGRAFAQYTAQYLDTAKYSPDADERKRAEGLVALLTPVCKAFFTDKGLEATILGQQVLGGHGYIQEWGQEQLVRDARIAQIYEGTNGIQALDLLGRKIVANGGQFYRYFKEDLTKIAVELGADAQFQGMANALNQAALHLDRLTDYVLKQASVDPCFVGAAAVEYLECFGLVAYAALWAKIAHCASTKTAPDTGGIYAEKVATARFFFARLLPRYLSVIEAIKSGSKTLYEVPEAYF